MKKNLLTKLFVLFALLVFAGFAIYAQTYHQLSSGPFQQNWNNTGLITTNDIWSGVPSIIGYRGDIDGTVTGVDPQTVLQDLSGVVNVMANQTNPNTYTTGGVAEFEITDPVVALQGSGTADAPNIVIFLNTTGVSNIRVKYDLRDIDGSGDNAVQPVALQYRIGTSGNYINIPAGFVADATTGPSIAELVTSVNVVLPPECNNQEQLQLRIITTNAVGNDEWVGIDNIVIEVDNTPPQLTFNPANNAINVPVNVKPTITFDEPVRKTDGSELTNADLPSLVSFKKNDASGEDVPFTAVIDADKKVITITPSSALSNGQVYYLAVGPVEDYVGNETTLKSITFTTILTAIPTITVTWPNGGEVMYSGDIKTVTWTTTDFAPTEMIKIEVYALDQGSGTWSWITIVPSTENDGACDVTVGPNAPYGTNYRIRVSGVTNGISDESDAPFTIIATATTMKQLRSNPAGSKVRFDGEAVITFIRTANRNQKYLQDATAGILIDDDSGVLTTTLAEGDKITSLEGQLGLYNGLLQIVPTKSTVNVVSQGNSVSPVVMTIGEYLANRAAFESMLIKLTNVYFPAGNGTATFTASTNYDLTDGTSTVQFRTFKATESNIVGSVIPVQHLDLTGIGGVFNTTAQVYSRTLADFSVITAIEKTGENDIRIYPVPFGDLLNLENIGEFTGVEIRDITGRVVLKVNNDGAGLIRIETAKLPSGIYLLKLISPQGTVTRKIVKK